MESVKYECIWLKIYNQARRKISITLQDVMYQKQLFFGSNSLFCLYNPYLWTKEPWRLYITADLSLTADRNIKKKYIKFLICCCFTLISLGFAHSLLQGRIITFYLRFSRLYRFGGTKSEIRNTIWILIQRFKIFDGLEVLMSLRQSQLVTIDQIW